MNCFLLTKRRANEINFILIGLVFIVSNLFAGDTTESKAKPKILYGTASFYANSFNGKKTANGEVFSQQKLTAACNVLPLGTWVKVTNLRNGKSVSVKINDRLHPKMTRVVDLSRSCCRKIELYKIGTHPCKG